MTLKNKAERPSKTPPGLRKQQEKAFGRLINIYRDALHEVTRERKEKALAVAEEMRKLFEPSEYGPSSLKEGLAACALGFMACLGPEEATAFLERSGNRIRKLLRDTEIESALVYAHIRGEEAHRRHAIIDGFAERAAGFMERYLMIHELDAMVTDGPKEYGQLYAEPLGDSEYPVPVLVAHQFFTEYVGMPPNLSAEEQLAKSDALEVFHYPIGEALGMRAKTIAAIGKVATETRLALGSGEQVEEDRGIYRECVEFRKEILPFAEEVQRLLVKKGGLKQAIKRAQKRLDWDIRLESQTIDPEESSRIKCGSRMLRKIHEKRDGGKPGFGVADVTDILGITLVVDRRDKDSGEPIFADANHIANALVVELKKSYGQRINITEIKTEMRKTGYAAPHLKFRMQVELGGTSREVPVEIQVRTRELQNECTKGRLSRGKKTGGLVKDALVEALAMKIERIKENLEATITRNSVLPSGGKIDEELVIIEVNDSCGGREMGKKRVVITKPGECVAGVIALIDYPDGKEMKRIGFGEQATAYGREGEKLGLFDTAPKKMKVELGGPWSSQMSVQTCNILAEKIRTPEALELLQEYMKQLKSMRENGRR